MDTKIHQNCFGNLVQSFKYDTFLPYFDSKKPVIITDAHVTGLEAILAQGCDLNSSKLVAIASRTTYNTDEGIHK